MKGWQRFALPMAALVVLFVMLFFAFIELRRENSAVQAGRENSPYWAVTQTERELIQLVALIDRFRLGDPEVNAEDISDRYRSVKARLSTLNRQAYRDVLIRIAGADETVGKVKVFVEPKPIEEKPTP